MSGVPPSFRIPALLVAPSGLGRRIAASAVTIAVATGVMGLATFGRFDAQHDPTTTSVLAPSRGR
jgi:hypothetical protein